MTTINGYPLWDWMPDAIEGKERWNLTSRVMNNSAGHSGISYDSAAPVVGRSYTWSVEGWENVEAMLDFLATVKGRYGAFYIPTWRDDFIPTDYTWTDGVTLAFEPFGFPDVFRRLKRRRVAFINNGVVDVRAIRETGVDDDGNEYLYSDDGFERPMVNRNTIISLCPLVRLTADAVEIEWRPHDAQADVTFNVTEVIAEAPVI